MATLLDIAKVTKTIQLGGIEIPVSGLTGQQLADLILRFPDIGKLVFGGNMSTNIIALVNLMPKACAAVIASGTGAHCTNDADAEEKGYEEVALELPLGDQVSAIVKILELTFPQGVGPFVEQLQKLGLDLPSAGDAQAANPRSPSSPD